MIRGASAICSDLPSVESFEKIRKILVVPVCHRHTPAIGLFSELRLLAIIRLPWPMTAPDQADAHEWTAITTPRLLAVPLVLFWAIWEEQKLLMPHKIRGLVLTIINDVGYFDKASNNWQ